MKPQPSAKSHLTGRHLDGCWFVAVTRGARLPTRAGFVQQAVLPVQSPGSSGLGCDFSAVWDEIAMPCQHRLSLPGLPQTGGTAGLLGRGDTEQQRSLSNNDHEGEEGQHWPGNAELGSCKCHHGKVYSLLLSSCVDADRLVREKVRSTFPGIVLGSFEKVQRKNNP